MLGIIATIFIITISGMNVNTDVNCRTNTDDYKKCVKSGFTVVNEYPVDR